MYNWDITENLILDFGDLDLIFKVTAVEKLKIHSEEEGGEVCGVCVYVCVWWLGGRGGCTGFL